MKNRGLIDRYKHFLPVNDSTPIISMGEGNTPLVTSQSLYKDIGCKNLCFKLEGSNPTGSFKDRGMVFAVSKAIEEGKKRIICASTGNTSASAAAYGARYGLETFVFIPDGKIAMGKLSQAMIYGAKIISIKGNFDEALKAVISISEEFNIGLVNSLNPYRIEGQKTGSFEIVDEINDSPDYLFIPVGNAGNITAYWKGFKEYKNHNKIKKLPKMMGFQAAGAAPIVIGKPVKNPETIATAIRIGNPASWENAEKARDESGGTIGMVEDKEILSAYMKLSNEEGIFCEPSSAASLAGLMKLTKEGFDFRDKNIVCILTGNGLKDPATVKDNVVSEIFKVDSDMNKIRHKITSIMKE